MASLKNSMPYEQNQHRFYSKICEKNFVKAFFFISMSIKKLRNTIQYSVPSIAEIDMSSSGSGYERHLTNSLTTIEKKN